MRRVVRPIRWWVHLYTTGLPPSTRDERRAEIESDLWEHSRFATEHASGHVGFAISVWTRWFLGMADDLSWRAEQQVKQRLQRRMATDPSVAGTAVSRRRLIALGAEVTIALALVTVVVVINTIEYNRGTQPSGGAAALLFVLAVAMAALASIIAARGFWIMRARPAEGAILVVGGSSVAGLAWYWLFIPMGLAFAVSVYGLRRAMRLTRAGRAP